jgi:hemerythrin
MNEWQAAFSVRHPVLDAQHQQLLVLCNRASACLADSSGQSVGDFHLILNDLMEYAQKHFRTEEQILRDLNWAGLDAQLAEHEAYLVHLVDFTIAAMFDNIDKEGLQQYLAKWWMRHILVSDMQFSSLFSGSERRSDDAKSIASG